MNDFLMPSLGADMDRGKLVEWLVKPGDQVHRGQVVALVETDKGIVEVEIWSDGIVEDLIVPAGPDDIAVGAVLARLGPATGRPAAPPAAMPETPVAAPPPIGATTPSPEPATGHVAHEPGTDPGGAPTRADVGPTEAVESRPAVSPRARRLAAELGVDMASVTPSRPDGLVAEADVRAAFRPASPEREDEPVEDQRAAAMRAAIAQLMARSNREIPHYYLGAHVDLSRALAWLDEYNTGRPMAERLLPAALFLKAAALAARRVPEVNGFWPDDHFVPSEAVHLGVAVSLRRGGLVAPAIHDADRLRLDELMAALRDLVQRARTGRLRSSEMSDPSITVTNLGDRGVETAYGVIYAPQVALVGFGRVVEQPWAENGLLGVRPVVHVTLSADHRASDGHRGGLYLAAIERLLQEPERL